MQAAGGESLKEQEAARRAGVPCLPAALRIVFCGAVTPAGGNVLFRLLPQWAERYLFHLLFRVLGSAARSWEYARTTLCLVSGGLLANAAAHARKSGQAVTMRETDWKWCVMSCGSPARSMLNQHWLCLAAGGHPCNSYAPMNLFHSHVHMLSPCHLQVG